MGAGAEVIEPWKCWATRDDPTRADKVDHRFRFAVISGPTVISPTAFGANSLRAAIAR